MPKRHDPWTAAGFPGLTPDRCSGPMLKPDPRSSPRSRRIHDLAPRSRRIHDPALLRPGTAGHRLQPTDYTRKWAKSPRRSADGSRAIAESVIASARSDLPLVNPNAPLASPALPAASHLVPRQHTVHYDKCLAPLPLPHRNTLRLPNRPLPTTQHPSSFVIRRPSSISDDCFSRKKSRHTSPETVIQYHPATRHPSP